MKELTKMAKTNIDVPQEILNKIDNELIALNRMLFDVLSVVSMLKFLSKALRDNQGSFTKH
jgi:hypothetical protein